MTHSHHSLLMPASRTPEIHVKCLNPKKIKFGNFPSHKILKNLSPWRIRHRFFLFFSRPYLKPSIYFVKNSARAHSTIGRKRGMNYPILPIFCLHIDHKVSQQFPQIFPHRPEAYPPYREQAFDMNFRGRPPDCPRRCSKCQNRTWHHQRKSNNRYGACTFRPEFTG